MFWPGPQVPEIENGATILSLAKAGVNKDPISGSLGARIGEYRSQRSISWKTGSNIENRSDVALPDEILPASSFRLPITEAVLGTELRVNGSTCALPSFAAFLTLTWHRLGDGCEDPPLGPEACQGC